MELAVVCSFGLASAFFVYLGNRLRLIPKESLSANADLIVRSGEIFAYSFAGLFVAIMMFLTMEFTSAQSYNPVIRSVFVVLQIILGLLAGLGSILGSVSLVVIALSRFFGGGSDAKK